MSATYLGIQQIQIKTFTTSYAPLTTPWSFNGYALQPMEFAATDTGAGVIRGIGGAVFDNNTGATKFAIGDLTGAFGGAISCLWNNNRLVGWNYGPANAPQSLTYSYPLTLGIPLTVASLGTSQGITTPSGSPNQYASTGFMCANGTVYGSFNNGPLPAVNQQYCFFNPVSLAAGPYSSAFSVLFGPSVVFGALIPHDGTNYIATGYQGGTGTKFLINTDFVNYATYGTLAIVNPPACSVDLNALIISQLQPSLTATYQGWLYINSGTITIGSVTLNGYGLLIEPDFSSYVVLQITPTDGPSNNWTASNGYVAKYDQGGTMWLKDAGSNTTIFTSIPIQSHILQVFPPVALPSPPADGETMMKAYEGYAL